MKRLILLSIFILSIFSQNVSTIDFGKFNGVVKLQDLKLAPLKLHPIAEQARKSGEEPSKFKGVTYKLRPNVKFISHSQKNSLNMKQDGLLDISSKTSFTPSPDSIYFDTQSDIIFQTAPLDDKQMLMLRPSLSSVFEDIDMPEQEVQVKKANTVFAAKDMLLSSIGANEKYAINMQFKNTKYIVYADKKDSLIVKLDGFILLTNPRVDGHYSKNNGFSLVFKTSEQVNLKIETNMKFNKEVEVPLWGTEIEGGDIGKAKLLIAMIIDVNGEVNLVVNVDQALELALGARGNTYWYVPTSIKKVAELQQHCEIDYEIKSKITAFAGVKCSAKMTFKGYNILDLYLKGGMEGTVETAGTDLMADIGIRIKAGGKVVTKKFTLFDQYTSLWKLQKPNTAGYKFEIFEACAYSDYIAGEVLDINDKPFSGDLEIKVNRDKNKTEIFKTSSNDKGLFIAKNIPLKKSDKVSIKVIGAPAYSQEFSTTIPFKDIGLLLADYFNESATLMVSASKSEWAKLAESKNNNSNIPNSINKNSFAKTAATKNINAISQSSIIEKLTKFRNNIISYSGPVSFLVKNAENQRAKREDILQGNITNNILGMCKVNGLKFIPGQYIQARIEIEGFIITSEWVPTDGLMISSFEHEDLIQSHSISSKSQTVEAKNSFIIISAVDGNKSPTGNVKLIKGFDSPHASVQNTVIVPEFPEAKKAALWFSKTVNLEQIPGQPGSSIASTGNWKNTYNYSNPSDLILPSKNGKHPFELVSYQYKDNELGYDSFIQECYSCKSPTSFIESLGKNNLLKEDKLNNLQINIHKTTPNIKNQMNKNIGTGLK